MNPTMPIRSTRGLRLLAAVLAVVSSVMTLSPAAAQVSGTSGPVVGGTADPGQTHNAPTANLSKLAHALRHKHKSVTSLVTAPAGLNLTNPVEISIGHGYGGHLTKQNYANGTGNRFLHNVYPADGQPTWTQVAVTLREAQFNGKGLPPTYIWYSFQWSAYIEPLWDIAIGSLFVRLVDDGDLFGSSELEIEWYAPHGGRGLSRHEGMDPGDTVEVTNFRETYTAVPLTSDLRVPWPFITETDLLECAFLDCTFLPPPLPSTRRLLPGTTHEENLITLDREGECYVDWRYMITYAMHTYTTL